MEEADVTKFEELLHETVHQLQSSDDTQRFAQYFSQYYYLRPKQWAVCYRHKAGINTNMFVEAFHHVLKYIYMKGKINKRVDKCVDVLIKIARDKAFERLIKLQKGKVSLKVSSIRTRHHASLKLPLKLVKEGGEDDWTVQSSNTTDLYHVTQFSPQCSLQQCLQCRECSICIHQFSCTCPDSVIHASICKHIHLVARHLKSKRDHRLRTTKDIHVPHLSTTHNTDDKAIFKEVQSKDHNCSIQDLKDSVQKKISQLQSSVLLCDDRQTLSSVYHHISSAINITKALASHPSSRLQSKSPIPHNKHIPTQRPFHSTKKHHRRASVRMAKPTNLQKQLISTELMEHLPLFSPSSQQMPTPGKREIKVIRFTS